MKAYRQIIKGQDRINIQMVQAMNEGDLGRFEVLSKELDEISTQRNGLKSAIEMHSISVAHVLSVRRR